MEQDKCGQRIGLPLLRHEPAEFSGQPHTLVAQFVADGRRATGGPVALGEDRVDAAEHVGRAFGQQLGRWYPKGDIGGADLGFGACDSLTDRRLAVQQGTGDLSDSQARHQPQRQGQLRCALQSGVGAGEHHAQFVIAHRVRIGDVGPGGDVIDHGGQFLSRT
ncbi:Uncharacterised protein [Mycobacteroides abscessus subsp. abscessus]|nr:Uncharacterised protein [Mycobacteroides abscessus subsp. abscessus]